jgi:hypothetical protein
VRLQYSAAVLQSQTAKESQVAKTYRAVIRVGDEPSRRLTILAESREDAIALIDAEFGQGHIVDLTDVEAAERPR